MSAYSDYVVAKATPPLHYWPCDETTGTTATDAIGSMDGTANGLIMGNGDGSDMPGGLGSHCLLFSGVEYVTMNAGAILGGLSAYTISVWGFYTPLASTDIRYVYAELGSSGSDRVLGGVKGSGSAASLRNAYGYDGAISINDSPSLALSSRWVLYHFTRDSATGILTASWQAGQRMSVVGPTSNTWTNSGVTATLGGVGAVGSWRGRLCHLAVYDRVLGFDEQLLDYQTGTPHTRVVFTGDRWTPTSPWNQLLTDPDNLPTIASNSDLMVANLVAQVTKYGAATNTARGPIWVADNSTPTEQVRIGGGPNNASTDKPNLYNLLADVPVPDGFGPNPGLADLEATIINIDTQDLYEFWVLKQDLLAPEFVSGAVSGVGTLPAGTYSYYVVPRNSFGERTNARQITPSSVTVNGSQGVSVAWGTVEGHTDFQIVRRLLSDPLYHPIAIVGPTVHGFFDNGTYPDDGAGASFPSIKVPSTHPTTDWGCSYAGVAPASVTFPGYWSGHRSNWGANAVSTPISAGVITLGEGVAADIPHALAMACVDTSNSHVFPAQRHDYWPSSNNIIEGTRYQLDPAFDVSTIPNLFVRAVAQAFQDYGGYITDHSAAISACYVEDDMSTGRNHFPAMYRGKQSYELFTNATFPFSQMRVIDPNWTKAQATATVPPLPPLPEAVGAYWGVRM